jgi:UDP-N-acetyl-D-mannosaminuronic acid dehydrogenase
VQRKFIVGLEQSVQDLLLVMSTLTESRRPSGFAVVLDQNDEIFGVVSDGDIRKFLINNSRMPKSIKEIVNPNYIFIENNPDPSRLLDKAWKLVSQLNSESRYPIKFLPVLEGKRIVGLLDVEEMSIIGDNRDDCIVVLGLGYVGLTLAGFFLSRGHEVIGIEPDQSKLKQLKDGESYITEPGLDYIIKQKITDNFSVEENLLSALELAKTKSRKVYVVCVPTPVSSLGIGDTKFVESAITEISKFLQAGDLVILRSTLPMRSSRNLASLLGGLSGFRPGIDFSFVFAPERTVEGNALKEIGELPQIVAGLTSHCLEKGLDFFEKFGILTVPVSSLETAELIKISSNAFRDYTFAFANYLSIVSQENFLDVNEIIKSANFGYPRNSIPTPSPGVGGPCLTKDPYLLKTNRVDIESPVKVARNLNEGMPKYLMEFVHQEIRDEQYKSFCIIGIAFKGIPETNDIRNSPGIDILNLLLKLGESVEVWDAVAKYKELPASQNSQPPNIFIIANNHPKNLEYFSDVIMKSGLTEIYVVDPWRMITSNALSQLRSIKKIHYFSLSHFERDI